MDRDGSISTTAFRPDDAVAVPAGPAFSVPVPNLQIDTAAVLVRIDKPHSVTVASEARLTQNAAFEDGALASTIFLAMVVGMLAMPLLFDTMFFIVLREKFVLLHAGMTIAMATYVMTAGGVISAFIALPIDVLARIPALVWAIGVGFGALFIAGFVEKGVYKDGERKLLRLLAAWTMIVPGFAALQLEATQSFDNQLYFYAFMPIIPALVAMIALAVWRGSRGARFLAVAWTPVVLASIDRLLKGMGVYAASDSIDLWLFFALAFEVLVVALAIADRFLALRRERDVALSEARTLEELSERDALTGLLNRRVIEERFEFLRAEGFTTLALIDLDHFKVVNDEHGHLAGDAVLKCVAAALRGDDDNMLAFRIGGEEFALLLRGENGLERAEQRRIAITPKIAEVRPVPDMITASMGVVEAPADTLSDASFEALYSRADRLLYQAKASGRDRTMAERLKVFRPRRMQEPRRAA
ncbi:diguanylate cyclase [Aurantiacibacter gangjinensis]|uniref:sensor domain-containing diguanylate cyclase n=1 Tax=Aurantiacibacter gangjinensis TaxID=502682 RepID=UPI00069BE298|nr:diguanylate cyclase [Aurantiacibacter gangjinensis]APE27272.1 GGDEF domain protein [Aurantiacibacter gangjinensis]